MIGIILSSFALATAAGCLALALWERKRSRELRAALTSFCRQSPKIIAERFKKLDKEWGGAVEALEARIKALEDGTVPDYEKAREAAKAVDEFHQGLANILNYDPYELAKKNREGED